MLPGHIEVVRWGEESEVGVVAPVDKDLSRVRVLGLEAQGEDVVPVGRHWRVDVISHTPVKTPQTTWEA